MVEVSIICLVYKSKKLAKAMYDSLYEYTPKLRNGTADLLFVANDPTTELVSYLKSQKYPFIINANDHLSDDELFKLGYGAPEYIRRVYQGYNQGILNAKGQKIVLINSDNFFSQDWLENLLKYSDYKKVVVSTLIEPGNNNFDVFPFAIEKDFGRTLETYKDKEFQNYVSKVSKTGYSSGGAYMPCLLYRDIAVLAGLYPEGNIAGKTFNEITRYGDEFFYDKLKSFGVEHITAKDSIIYHLKEGEKSEVLDNAAIVDSKKYRRIGLNSKFEVKPTNLVSYIKPDPEHLKILDKLGHKLTVIIVHFNDKEELASQIEQIKDQEDKNIEIIVMYNNTNKNSIESKDKDIRYVYYNNAQRDVILRGLLYKVYGEYLLVPDLRCSYDKNIFEKIDKKDTIYYIGTKPSQQGLINDLIGKFIIPKDIVLSDIDKFLELLLNVNNVEFELNKCYLINEPIIEYPTKKDRVIKKVKSSLPYRVTKKMYREGPRGISEAILYKMKRK